MLTNCGYNFLEGYIKANLAKYLNKVIGLSKSKKNSYIVFVFLVISTKLYLLQDPRNIKANSDNKLKSRTL